MKGKLALVALLAMAAASSAPAPESAFERPLCCRECGTRVYRAGLDKWFCGRCGKAVTP